MFNRDLRVQHPALLVHLFLYYTIELGQSSLRYIPCCQPIISCLWHTFENPFSVLFPRLFNVLLPTYLPQWVYKSPSCINLRIKMWVVTYLEFIIFLKEFKRKNLNFILYNFLVLKLQYLKILKRFCPQKVKKKHPQELLRKTQIHFFPYCLSCPNGPNRRIHVPKGGL